MVLYFEIYEICMNPVLEELKKKNLINVISYKFENILEALSL